MGTRRVRRKEGDFTLFFRKVSPFSNHHPAGFVCDESINFKEPERFSCTEQYYMYNKASLLMNRQLMSAVLNADNPRAMKSMCSKGALRGWNDSLWDEHKKNVMYIGCSAKFRSSRHLRYALFLTIGSRLVECSPFDTIWGIGKDLEAAEWAPMDSGKNLLGKILDRVREELWEDLEYEGERKEVEKRIEEDKDYLMKAVKHIDLMYKARATQRYLLSKGHLSVDNQTYLTSDVQSLLPAWAFPPPIEKNESIRASPPQITHFQRTPPIRAGSVTRGSMTPPVQRPCGSRLFGRLTVSEIRPIESRDQEKNYSRAAIKRCRSRTRSRSRNRSRSYERSRKRRNDSRSSSPKIRKKKRSSEEKEDRMHRKKSHKKKSSRDRSRSRQHRRHRSDSNDSRLRRSGSREDRRRRRKERKQKKKEKKERKQEKKEKKEIRRRRTPSTSQSEY